MYYSKQGLVYFISFDFVFPHTFSSQGCANGRQENKNIKFIVKHFFVRLKTSKQQNEKNCNDSE